MEHRRRARGELTIFLPLVLALLALLGACAEGAPAPGTVRCADLDAGYRAVYSGTAALVDCVRDPRLQTPGAQRLAELGPGSFDFADGSPLWLDTGWSVRGAGPDETALFATRPSGNLFGDGLYSAFVVSGARVTLAGFRFDGACGAGPSPPPECRRSPDSTLLALVVACGFGFEAPPDCDVDGLRIEDVRVLHTKTAFVASTSPPRDGAPGLFANFRDFRWTIRRFQVSDLSDPFRYARIFELGNAADPLGSQGPGAGSRGPRRYAVHLEDTSIDARVGRFAGDLGGVLTATVNAEAVELAIHVTNSTLRGTQRVVGLGTHTVPGAPSAGRIELRCTNSALVANHPELREPARQGAWTGMCPAHPAAVQLGEGSLPGGEHGAGAAFVGCRVEVLPWLSLCDEPAAIDLGSGEAATRSRLCLTDTPVLGGVRRDGQPVDPALIPACPYTR